METKINLEKVGSEGFALLDEYYSNRRQRSQTNLHQYQPQKPLHVYQANPISRTEKMISIQKYEAKQDLVKIATEGFALVDEYYGKNSRPVAYQKPTALSKPAATIQGPPEHASYSRYHGEKPRVYQVKPGYASQEKVMNAYEAAKKYGGVLIIRK